MPRNKLHILFAVLIVCALPGCAVGRWGSAATKSTLTPTAEVVDVYAFGARLGTEAMDAGVHLGWGHTTYIYPRHAQASDEPAFKWTLGWRPKHEDQPFFLATRRIGVGAGRAGPLSYAHVGYRQDSFTFAGSAAESRHVSFHYKPGDPAATDLTMLSP